MTTNLQTAVCMIEGESVYGKTSHTTLSQITTCMNAEVRTATYFASAYTIMNHLRIVCS